MPSLVEQILSGLSIEELRSMDYEAEKEFRRARTPQELFERQQEWRAIETVYLAKLKEFNSEGNQNGKLQQARSQSS